LLLKPTGGERISPFETYNTIQIAVIHLAVALSKMTWPLEIYRITPNPVRCIGIDFSTEVLDSMIVGVFLAAGLLSISPNLTMLTFMRI